MADDSTRKPNRSIPASDVMPVLEYADVEVAVEWLCRVFGFDERLRIANHRSQLTYGNGSMVVTEFRGGALGERSVEPTRHSLLMRVADANTHHERARTNGARIVSEPVDQAYGERQYSAVDLGGHQWTFSESIADSDPASWGGVLRPPA